MGSRIGPEKWLASNQEIWGHVLCRTLVAKITNLGGEQSWSTVKNEIAELIEGSSLGAKLFGWVAKEITGVELATTIRDQVSRAP